MIAASPALVLTDDTRLAFRKQIRSPLGECVGRLRHRGFKKASPQLVERFEAALPQNPLVERRKMFGYPASFVNGNFFAGLHEENAVLRLPETLWTTLPDLAGATGFDPMGRGKAMKGWLVIPPAVTAQPNRLAALLQAALPLVAALPAKTNKKPRRLSKRA